MKEKRKALPRAMLVYLAVIVAPALALLYLGARSVERQQAAVRALAESNRVMGNEKVAVELEARIRRLVGACLGEQGTGPPFRCGHPVAADSFALREGRVVHPRLEALPPRAPQGVPAVFREAEEAEIQRGEPGRALALYRSAYELGQGAEAQALALSRTARCLEKLGRKEEAAQTWRTLRDKHAAVRDPSHRPFGLTARFELHETEGLYEELVQDRWELAAEQFDYYLGRLGREAPAGHRFALARALDEGFRHMGPLREGEIYRQRLPEFEIYYRTAGEMTVGFALDARWVREKLEPEVRAELGLPGGMDAAVDREFWLFAGASGLVMALLLGGVLLVMRDVTREARMTQLRAEFVSGVSHDLKTPLTLIRLYAETLLIKEYPAEERRGFYEIITRESERLSQLIQKVLTFSRIERGEKEYAMESGDLSTAIGRTLEIYRPYLEKAGFEVEADLPAGLATVRFDEGAVSQAVVNLLDNVLKYSGAKKYAGLRLYEDRRNLIFAVEDRGIGIAPGERERIFERFYRAANGAGKGGYGLGLYLVRHIMEAHAGRVEVESEPGRGSCFRLVFPAAG